MQDILVKTLMSEHIIQVAQESGLRSVLAQMTQQNHSCVIICENGSPIGIVTERDIVRRLQQTDSSADLLALNAASYVPPIMSLNQNQSLFDALVISRANSIRHFPVVDDDEKTCRSHHHFRTG